MTPAMLFSRGIALALCCVICPAIWAAPVGWRDSKVRPTCKPEYFNGTSSGFIKSANYPENYSTQMDCFQVITVEEGNLVQLIFYAFETELGADVVTLYDGPPGPTQKEITENYRLSGVSPMHGIYKTHGTNVMIVRFKTDFDHTFKGYFALYQSISPARQESPLLGDCKNLKDFTNDFDVIVSPNWPDLYPNQAHCTYKIRLPRKYVGMEIRVNFFETEDNADIVFVYKGTDTLSKHLVTSLSGRVAGGHKIIVNDRDATLVFMSDFDGQFLGFSLTYSGLEGKLAV